MATMLPQRKFYETKKVLSLGLCLAMVMNISMNVHAASPETPIENNLHIITCRDYSGLDHGIPNLPIIARYEDSMISSKKPTIRVDICTPLEKAWRDKYSNYFFEANEIVEASDNMLYDKFGIDFYTVSQPSWTWDKSRNSNALNDAISQCGKGNADIMLAFAGYLDAYTYGQAAEEESNEDNNSCEDADSGEPYCIIYDNGREQNCKSAQHEIGHTYGLKHCEGTNCVMNQGKENGHLFGNLCDRHVAKWGMNSDNY